MYGIQSRMIICTVFSHSHGLTRAVIWMAPLIVAVTTTAASINEPKQNTYQYCKASVYALSDISSLPTITQFAIESMEN